MYNISWGKFFLNTCTLKAFYNSGYIIAMCAYFMVYVLAETSTFLPYILLHFLSDLNSGLYVIPWEFIIMNCPNVDSALSNITYVIHQTLKVFITTKIVYPSNKSKQWFNR